MNEQLITEAQGLRGKIDAARKAAGPVAKNVLFKAVSKLDSAEKFLRQASRLESGQPAVAKPDPAAAERAQEERRAAKAAKKAEKVGGASAPRPASAPAAKKS